MEQDRLDRSRLERATLRLRLAGVALGATLLVLAPRSDQTAAAATLVGYLAIVLALRLVAPRVAAARLPALAVAIDVLFAAALTFVLPLAAGGWALFAVPIATGALLSGPIGAALAAAASIVGYDLVLAARSGDLQPSDLWPVQLLLAFGLIAAELVWAVARADAARRRLRSFALAQRDLIAAEDEPSLLGRLTDHAVRTFEAESAWIERADGPAARREHERGLPAARPAPARIGRFELTRSPATTLAWSFVDASAAERGEAGVRDLALDAVPLLAAIRGRERVTRQRLTAERTLEGARRLSRDRSEDGVLAEVLVTAAEIAGPAALVRRADGTVIAGDLGAAAAEALTRDVAPPALLRAPATSATGARTAIVVSAGPGIALVTSGARRDLTEDDTRALAALGEIAAAAIDGLRDRAAITARRDGLGRELAELDARFRQRDDAVASAVHELRTPLTSVQAYGQLMSRNLTVVQQQVKQLDRLIADLLHEPAGGSAGLVLEEIDVLRELRDAVNRVRVVSSAQAAVQADGPGPFVSRADPSRIAQVFDNVLRNAVKFSGEGEPIDVTISRERDEIIVSVADRGAGIPRAELDLIFERYYRGSAQRRSVPGEGLGLAVSREIVTSHGGRIWATSDGPGEGSTFFIALPAAQPSRREAEIPFG